MRQGSQIPSVRRRDPNGLPNLKGGPRSVQFLAAGLLQQIQKRCSATVANRGLVGIQLNQGVIDVQTAQGGKQMLDGADFNTALGQGGRPLHLLHLFQKGRNHRLISQVHPAELVTRAGAGRFYGEPNLGPAMQGDSGQAGFLFDRGFACRRHPAFYTFPTPESSLLSSRFALSARLGS